MTHPFEDTIRRLLDWELVDEAAILAGDLKVSSAARRNLNLRLERRQGPSYLIKQRTEEAVGAPDPLAREAAFYAYCAERPETAAVAGFLPRMHACLDSGSVLVLELLKDARTLWQEYGEQDPHQLRLAAPLALGRALGTLHSTFRGSDLTTDPRLAGLGRDCPPCFNLHRPHPGILQDASQAQLEVCRAVQQDAKLSAGLAKARAGWRCETLVHGDIRPDNVLFATKGSHPAVWLVDWEFVQQGDPAWDVGCVLHDHLVLWVRSMPLMPGLDAGLRADSATYPLGPLQAAMGALWTGYLATASVTDREAAELLDRAALFCGARLVHTAWEKARGLEQQSVLGVLVLQLGANLLADPGRAAVDLCGFEPPQGASGGLA